MAKKAKPQRASKKNLAKNTAWLEERLESTMLDLDALSAMPIEDVHAELKVFKQDQSAFIKMLNEKLPAGASIPVTGAKQKSPGQKSQTRKAKDRVAAAPPKSFERRSSRIFNLKTAFFLSLIIIAVSLFLPQFIRDLKEDKLESATAIKDEVVDNKDVPPTWIEGPAVDELVRGVKYKIAGLEQVVLEAPLPENPGDLSAIFQMRAAINGAGNVVQLEPLPGNPTDFEPLIIDSLLHWKFSPLPDSSQIIEALITIEYLPR